MSRLKKQNGMDKSWMMFTTKDHQGQLMQLYSSSRCWMLGNGSYNRVTVTQQQHQQLLTPKEPVKPELRLKQRSHEGGAATSNQLALDSSHDHIHRNNNDNDNDNNNKSTLVITGKSMGQEIDRGRHCDN